MKTLFKGREVIILLLLATPCYAAQLSSGDLVVTGDVTIQGDDLIMTTNTAGAVLVGDGTNYNPVVMSADAAIDAAGAVTVANDSHDHTTTTISGLDISADTNLAVTAPVVLTDDTLSVSAASTTAAGVSEIAIASEVDTGTSTTLVVSPDALAGSIHGEKIIYVKVLLNSTAVTTGDGKAYVTIPDSLNGMDLVDADAAIYTASSSGNPSWQIHNLTDASDMLSTVISVDAGTELNSYIAATQPVINAAEDDVVTGDILRIDCDIAGTGTTGTDIILTFKTP